MNGLTKVFFSKQFVKAIEEILLKLRVKAAEKETNTSSKNIAEESE